MSLRLPVEGVLAVPPTVLLELDPVGIVLLVLQGGVVPPLADGAGECVDFFHACLFGWEKEKSLGSLGLVNSSRGFGGSTELPPKKPPPRAAGQRPVFSTVFAG